MCTILCTCPVVILWNNMYIYICILCEVACAEWTLLCVCVHVVLVNCDLISEMLFSAHDAVS